ncbi:hypothetical protein HG1285_06963, partial [Hydrogenivirga sp. 128-5-R1-1]
KVRERLKEDKELAKELEEKILEVINNG